MTPVTLRFLSFVLSLSFPQHNVCTITRTVAAAIGARTVPANIALAAFSKTFRIARFTQKPYSASFSF
jgi:hypothetical protein